MKAVVTGLIATWPVGGVAWDYGQYVLGLERLGVEVTYLEDPGQPGYNPVAGAYEDDLAYGAGFLEQSLRALCPGVGDRWHVRAPDGTRYGMPAAELEEAVGSADVFINVSCACVMRAPYLRCRRKVLIDTDPGVNHFAEWRRRPEALGLHDVHLTYAQCLGDPGCRLPSMGLEWERTRPPVVLDAWEPEPDGDTWTTVMSWRNFRPIVHGGRTYGAKEREFRHIEDLPRRTGSRMEVAVGGVHPPYERWRAFGWNVIDSYSVSATADDYRRYVAGSFGELSVAKNVYVDTMSGWFSCRSVCYLAAGRPAVLQDTGWSRHVPHGEGLLAFEDSATAAAAVAAVEADPSGHAEAARAVAETTFASDVVLADLLDRATVTA